MDGNKLIVAVCEAVREQFNVLRSFHTLATITKQQVVDRVKAIYKTL